MPDQASAAKKKNLFSISSDDFYRLCHKKTNIVFVECEKMWPVKSPHIVLYQAILLCFKNIHLLSRRILVRFIDRTDGIDFVSVDYFFNLHALNKMSCDILMNDFTRYYWLNIFVITWQYRLFVNLLSRITGINFFIRVRSIINFHTKYSILQEKWFSLWE